MGPEGHHRHPRPSASSYRHRGATRPFTCRLPSSGRTVLTRRPDDLWTAGSTTSAESAMVLRLDPLQPQPMRRLLQSMFGLDDIPESFVARVLEEAGGSPFFLEEVVRVLVENGSVFVESGAWKTATAVGDLEIPASIVATLRRRLAMLMASRSTGAVAHSCCVSETDGAAVAGTHRRYSRVRDARSVARSHGPQHGGCGWRKGRVPHRSRSPADDRVRRSRVDRCKPCTCASPT